MRMTRLKHWILATAAVMLAGTFAVAPATAAPLSADPSALDVELKRET